MNTYYRFDFQAHPRSARLTHAVQRLILANVIVYAGQLVADVFLPAAVPGHAVIQWPPGGWLVLFLSFQPAAFLSGFVWQPLTYMFLHGGLGHLFMNMLYLFFFGPEVERILSTRRFYWFYLLCGAVGVFATFVPFFAAQGHASSVVGASGACMGLLVAFAMTYPERQIFLFPLPVPINARALIIIAVIMNLVYVLRPDGISVATHFGGMIVAFAYMKLVPKVRTWRESRRGHGPAPAPDRDAVGEAVDNIFRFRDEKRRRQ